MRERCGYVFTTSATLAYDSPCLFYGIVLTSKAGNASAVIHDHGVITGSSQSTRYMLVEQGAVTGTTTVMPPLAVGLETGLVVSLSAGAVATIFVSKRA